MDYVGIDHLIGLSCRSCRTTTAMPYSWLLNVVLDGRPVVCDYCRRTTNHGWDSVEAAQLLVARHMRESRKQVA
jgi:hypothetical protein